MLILKQTPTERIVMYGYDTKEELITLLKEHASKGEYILIVREVLK